MSKGDEGRRLIRAANWVVHHVEMAIKVAAHDAGLTASEAAVILVLSEWPSKQPKATLGDIQRAIFSNTPPSRLVGGLTDKRRGLALERRDPKDKRKYRFSLTPKGKRLARKLEAKRDKAIAGLTRKINAAELKAARQSLAELGPSVPTADIGGD